MLTQATKCIAVLSLTCVVSCRVQVALVILFGTCTKFDASLSGQVVPSATGAGQLNIQYAMFSDTHTMMIIGFGFLYTLMRKYAWSGVSWNFLITALVVQWAALLNGFWEHVAEKAVRTNPHTQHTQTREVCVLCACRMLACVCEGESPCVL